MAKAEGERTEERKYTKRKKKQLRKPTVEKEIKIARMIEEKQEEKEDLIEIRTVKEMIPRRFHKYLKVLEKKESERIPTRKI